MMLPTAHASAARDHEQEADERSRSRPRASLCAASSDDAGDGDDRADEVVPLQPVAVEQRPRARS